MILLPPNVISRPSAKLTRRQTEDVVGRHAVFPQHRPPALMRDVCPPIRTDLRGTRVRRIPETVLTGDHFTGGVRRARLDNDRARVTRSISILPSGQS